jgi:hypothetical protein
MKKVILLLVDSLMPTALEAGIRHKTVPALQFLMDRGRYWNNCATVYPTMTASVDSSLLTGVYPDMQPDFMLIYLPDNDHEVHKKNPVHAEEALIRFDRNIQL